MISVVHHDLRLLRDLPPPVWDDRRRRGRDCSRRLWPPRMSGREQGRLAQPPATIFVESRRRVLAVTNDGSISNGSGDGASNGAGSGNCYANSDGESNGNNNRSGYCNGDGGGTAKR